MQKHKNTVKHDPANGSWGNCHQACVATILGLPMEAVPHFYDGGDALPEGVAEARVTDFLAGIGLVRGNIIYDAATSDLDQVLHSTGVMMPGVAMILGGMSRSGCGHSVVIMDGEIYNDPTDGGIIGPMPDGYYWLTVFSPKPGSLAGGNLEGAAQ
jgi:hypothetical protein